MTELIVPVGGRIVEQVTARIRFEVPSGTGVTGNLQKVSSPAAIAAAKEAWAKIVKVLKQAAISGWSAVQAELAEVNAFIEERVAELMAEADQLREALLEKLHETMRGMLDFVLKSIRNRVQIGDDTYVLGSIDLQSKLVYSGSIEASIAALCKFVASGETVVTGKYTLLAAP